MMAGVDMAIVVEAMCKVDMYTCRRERGVQLRIVTSTLPYGVSQSHS